MASVFGMAHPSVLREMQAIDSEVISGGLSPTLLHKKFQTLEPRLAHITDVTGSTNYQIIINTPPDQSTSLPMKDHSSEWLQKFCVSTHVNILFLFVVTCTFGFAYNYQADSMGLDKIAPADPLWSKEGVTVLAVLLKIFWTTMERGKGRQHPKHYP
jgi:hypothetical protein